MPSTASASKIARLFSMQWSVMLSYRFDLFLWTLTEAMVPLIALAIWYTVARTNQAFSLTPAETLTYYVLIIFVTIITTAWNGFFFARDILTGAIAPGLLRPLPMAVFWQHVANNLVEKAVKLVIPVPVMLAALFFFHDSFAPAIFELRNILAFTVSLILGTGISFVLDMALGAVAFWLEDANQIRRFKDLLYEVASGILIPFAALPALAVSILSFLPFRYIVSVPLEMLMGKIVGTQVLVFLGLQAAWFVGLTLLLSWMWVKGLKRYAVPAQ